MTVKQKANHGGYKTTIFGEVPSNWEEGFLGEYIIEHKELTEINNQYPVLTSSRNGLVKQEEYYKNRQIITDNVGYHVIPKGYFTYRSRSDDGTFVFNINNIVDKGIVSYFYPVFKVEGANDYYVWSFMNSLLLSNQIIKEIVGTSQLVLSLNKLKKMKILLPPLDEQQRIVEILSTVDTQIENTEKLIQKTKELKKGLMQQLLMKGIGHTEFKQTEVGLIPSQWRVVKLNEFVESLDAGTSVNSIDTPAKENEFGVIKTSALSGGHFLPSKNKVILLDELHRAKISPKKNAVLISRMNTPQLVGEVAYVEKDYPNLFLPDRVWQTRYKYEICGKWLAELLSAHQFRYKIRTAATGTSNSMKNISKDAFMSLMVPLPSIEEQQQIADILSTIDMRIHFYEQEKEKQLELKKGLMQQLLTGKIRVTV